jgi:hypothetical protein
LHARSAISASEAGLHRRGALYSPFLYFVSSAFQKLFSRFVQAYIKTTRPKRDELNEDRCYLIEVKYPTIVSYSQGQELFNGGIRYRGMFIQREVTSVNIKRLRNKPKNIIVAILP